VEHAVSGEDKRFDATPSRRERAKREGNLAQSAELNGIAAFAAATLAATFAVPFGAGAVVELVRDVASHPLRSGPAASWSGIACGALLPALAAAAGGTSASLLQRGGLHIGGLKLEAKRLDPFAGFKRVAGAEVAIAIARATLGFMVTLAAVVPLAFEMFGLRGGPGTPSAAAALVGMFALRACIVALVVGVAFAGFDYALARRRWLRGLKMSLHEIKRDAKENEGDPQARARRKGAHRAIVRGAIGRVREASFVVVNPTHVAVALRYSPPAFPVPEILVRAVDDVALRVRAIAREHGIPLVEDVALARLLYAHGESGHAIPPDTYVAVAHIIAALARERLL
jgi:flagellar biosynthesis protein FlhB